MKISKRTWFIIAIILIIIFLILIYSYTSETAQFSRLFGLGGGGQYTLQ